MTCVRLLTVAWQQAEAYLEVLGPLQRGLCEDKVACLAALMSEDKFVLSPDPVVRAKEQLFNGQHRLTAQVAVKKDATYLVFESDDDIVYTMLESGLAQALADPDPLLAQAGNLTLVYPKDSAEASDLIPLMSKLNELNIEITFASDALFFVLFNWRKLRTSRCHHPVCDTGR